MVNEGSYKHTDILSPEDVKRMVDGFYDKVRADALLGPVFQKAIGDDWSHHLPIMYRFWSTLLLDEQSYQGNPFSKHIPLPISETHFDRWIELFIETIDELFSGDKAEEAKSRAKSIAVIFQKKLSMMGGRH